MLNPSAAIERYSRSVILQSPKISNAGDGVGSAEGGPQPPLAQHLQSQAWSINASGADAPSYRA
jgi:hypothetical protein